MSRTAGFRVFGVIMLSVVTALAACSNSDLKPEAAPNLLLAPSPLPFQAPPWDKMKSTEYAPAFDEAIKQHNVEID